MRSTTRFAALRVALTLVLRFAELRTTDGRRRRSLPLAGVSTTKEGARKRECVSPSSVLLQCWKVERKQEWKSPLPFSYS